MKVAIRHMHGLAPQAFDVLTEHEDGTVDLGRDGQLVIAHSKVTESPVNGACVIVEAQPVTPQGIDLTKLKKDELIARAQELGLELPASATKDDIINAIRSHKEPGEDDKDPEE